jgi:hypothetical protein
MNRLIFHPTAEKIRLNNTSRALLVAAFVISKIINHETTKRNHPCISIPFSFLHHVLHEEIIKHSARAGNHTRLAAGKLFPGSAICSDPAQ